MFHFVVVFVGVFAGIALFCGGVALMAGRPGARSNLNTPQRREEDWLYVDSTANGRLSDPSNDDDLF